MMKFKAEEVFVQNDKQELLHINFSGSLDGSRVYCRITDVYDRNDKLEIMRGMDTYYIELNNRSNGVYGGIKEVRLTREGLYIVLHETGKEQLKTKDHTLEIAFQLPDEKLMELKEKLHQIFGPEKGDRKVNEVYAI